MLTSAHPSSLDEMILTAQVGCTRARDPNNVRTALARMMWYETALNPVYRVVYCRRSEKTPKYQVAVPDDLECNPALYYFVHIPDIAPI